MAGRPLVAEYSTLERRWYLWDGQEAVLDGDGELRLFDTAHDAYAWVIELEGGE